MAESESHAEEQPSTGEVRNTTLLIAQSALETHAACALRSRIHPDQFAVESPRQEFTSEKNNSVAGIQDEHSCYASSHALAMTRFALERSQDARVI